MQLMEDYDQFRLFIFGRGLWNVHFVTRCYLVRGDIIHMQNIKPNFRLGFAEQILQYKSFRIPYDFELIFGNSMREKDIDMFVTNRQDFGYLMDFGNIVIE